MEAAVVPEGRSSYTRERIQHWDAVARQLSRFDRANRGYHDRLRQIYASIIPPGQRVLELGSGGGDLLAAVRPAHGVGVDFSGEMVSMAATRHPGLSFVQADAHDCALGETFDWVILADLVNDVWDIQRVLETARRHASPHGRIVLNFYSRLWEQPLRVVKSLGWSRPALEQNWVTLQDTYNLLDLADCEPVRHSVEVLWPLRTPGAAFFNQFLVRLWPFTGAGLTHVVVARPHAGASDGAPPRVSVVVPARNEAGNIPEIFERVPAMGGGTELVFVEGHSRDDTYDVIGREIANRPDYPATLIRQPGEGKGDAVRAAFAVAKGDVLMILDADLTVRPEDLPRFYDALVSGKGDFINGVRLVYPMEAHAMRFFHLVGNRFFSWLFSWLLGQPIRDTLCGTKVLWRRDYERIAHNRAFFGDFDPFGDFDLLFGAAKLTLKIVEIPIRYGQRRYGTTNIQRWKHGVLLLRMSLVAARKLKCV